MGENTIIPFQAPDGINLKKQDENGSERKTDPQNTKRNETILREPVLAVIQQYEN